LPLARHFFDVMLKLAQKIGIMEFNKQKNKKICNCKTGIITAAVVFAIVVVAAIWLLANADQFNFGLVQTNGQKWRNFSEKTFGFSMEYPPGWAFSVNYDRYAKGLIDIDLSNKKCDSGSKNCRSDCANIKILGGKVPEGGQASALFVQLYENFMMVRDFSGAPMVQTLNLEPKKVFKVADEEPTLALTGTCGGPLYVFETGSGYFVYVFTGLGADAAVTNQKTIEKIISSIEIK